MRKARRRVEWARLQAELDDARPYLALAREIQEGVERVSADPDSDAASLAVVFDGIDRDARLRTAREVFDRLPPDQQWAVIERVYGDEEIAEALAEARAAFRAEAPRRAERTRVAAAARTTGRLATDHLPPDERLTLGLFRETDVRAGIERGAAAAHCARRLVLLTTADGGSLQVLEDVFNPGGDLFVTAQYDEETWRACDRLPAHALVHLGSISEAGGSRDLDPVLHLGGRVDVAVDGEVREGRLHLGFAVLGDQDVFVA